MIFAPREYQGKWPEIFANEQPIHLELGCGRGRFIHQLAVANPGINYLAVDIYSELLVEVLRKANQSHLSNLKLIPLNIENIAEVFAQGEIEKLYINFCNPWPNKRHHKRRLTHPNFLRLYRDFLKPGSEIWFKTDNDLLFADSLDYFRMAGFSELYRTYDLHQSDFPENVMTEYEQKFREQGSQIKFARFQI